MSSNEQLKPLLNIEKSKVKNNINKEPKVLTIDIETSPNVADVWGLWNQNIGLNQLRESSRVLCFAAKWHDKKTVEFYSEENVGHEEMVKQAWRLLDEADIVVGYNTPAFDIKHLQREFILAGMTPPSPFKNVDLLRTARTQFRFPSNKLDYVGNILGLGQKVKHAGHDLWTRISRNESAAWKEMKVYNVQDVRLTEALFDYLGPWIKGMPHRSLWTGEYGCYSCGSANLEQSGYHMTPANVFVRLHCNDCGAWSRGNTGRNKTETKAL